MKRKQLVKRILLIASLVAALSIVVGVMQRYIMCRYDAHQRRMEGFYLEEKNSLDMIVLGSSEVYNDFVPPLAYEKYGITSYIYGFQANPAALWSYQLNEIERTQDPSVLVIECNGAGYDQEELDNPAEVRFMTDDMPLSLNKIRLINDKASEGKLSYYFPFLKYHQHLFPSGDLENKRLLEKRGFHILRGAQARVAGEDLGNVLTNIEDDNSVAELDPAGEAYLRDFLEQCKSSDIEHIVFVRFPHVVTDSNYLRFQRYHRMKEIIEEEGFEYIDFDAYKDEMNIDNKTDFLDCEHMNSNGARKLTEFMIPFFVEKYQIQPREQSDKVKEQWDQSVRYYNRLYEYWCYLQSQDGEKTWEMDLNDNCNSMERIDEYFANKNRDL